MNAAIEVAVLAVVVLLAAIVGVLVGLVLRRFIFGPEGQGR